MEYEVVEISKPRINQNMNITFMVKWRNGENKKKKIQNLIPGCNDLIQIWIDNNINYTNARFLKELLKQVEKLNKNN